MTVQELYEFLDELMETGYNDEEVKLEAEGRRLALSIEDDRGKIRWGLFVDFGATERVYNAHDPTIATEYKERLVGEWGEWVANG